MFDSTHGLWIAHCDKGPLSIVGKMANRHGLVAGATGTGKTVTLQVMAESFCQAGVPCFMADMKGDLSGISQPGKTSGFIEKRMPEFGIENPEFQSCPVRFYDVFGEQGHPMRCTISQMGPQLLTRILGLTDAQEGVLNIMFRIADERGLLLDDIKDMRSCLNYISEHAAEYSQLYGNIATVSVGGIQRALLTLENEGADMFFGQPSFDILDLLATEGGKGVMSVLAADRLMLKPKLYSTFLLWLLSELYVTLPEVGDMDLPKLVFFFDEAHMLFDDTSKALTDKIEQVVRLIRSKGVGVYFVTQSPTDIPYNILGQLGNRVQHALRAFTPRDQKAVQVAADTFRTNPEFNTYEAITNLGTGEALVSFLDEKGAPNIVQKAKILFPLSQIGAIDPSQRTQIINRSRIYGKYDKTLERESAFEVLMAEREAQLKEADKEEAKAGSAKAPGKSSTKAAKVPNTSSKKKTGVLGKVTKAVITAVTATVATAIGNEVSGRVTGKKKNTSAKDSAGKVVKSATSAATRTITREITRSILGNLGK
jgi:DNA helicase HerA-like ATPase